MKRCLCGFAALGLLLTGLAGQATADYVFTTLDVPGSLATLPAGINNAGQIVGSYLDPHGGRHGFMLSSGSYATLDPPGSNSTFLQGVNDTDQIVGYYYKNTPPTMPTVAVGFLLSGGH